jgi:Lrp/AsnC family transcriptional regulator, regulator for asnA, asnC and gidA
MTGQVQIGVTMHNTFDLFLKIRAKDLNRMRDIIENKIRVLPNILETELMTILKTTKEEQMISSLNKRNSGTKIHA